MIKKLLAILLAISMLVPSSVYAQEFAAASNPEIVRSGSCGDNVTYTVDSNGLVTISGKGPMTIYENPHLGQRISPFYDKGDIKSVVIQNGVTNVGDYAFYDLGNLKSLKIGNSLTYIGKAAFCGCDLQDVSLGNHVDFIGANAFSYNHNLKKLSLPDSVKTIKYEAFQECHALKDLYLSKFLVTIEEYAFFECNSLYILEIPDYVKTIDNYAFADCDNLKIVITGASVTNIGKGAFYLCPSLISVSLGRSVKSIGEEAFFRCPNMELVTIPANVTSIGDRAFGYDSSGYYWDSPSVKDGFTIYGTSGSTAQRYANNNKIPFQPLKNQWGDYNTAIEKPAGVKGKAGKKKITLSWNKAEESLLERIDKIQLQYSTNKSFKNCKKITLGKKKTKKVIKNLKSKRTYYIRLKYIGKSDDDSKWTEVKVKTK